MSPEQVDGQQVDRRCDVFAAGILLWEAITGTRLFRGEDEFDEMRRVMTAPIPRPSSLVACGPDVDALLGHALARRTDERFQTALAFARALEHAIPPAPPAAVGSFVETVCAPELDYRYTRLLGILGPELEKLSPRTPKPHSHGAAAGPPPSRQATVRLEQAPRAPPRPALPPETLESSGEEKPRAVPPRRSLAPLFVAVTLVSLLVGAAGAFFWINR
jgi:serine/threonine-protein kinase